MDIIIANVNDGFRLTMVVKNDKNRMIKSTNNMDKIRSLVKSFPSNPKLIEVKGNDLKIIYNG